MNRIIFKQLAVYIVLSCSAGAFAEEADNTPSPAVTGEWEGLLSCNQRTRREVREGVALTIESGQEGRYQAVVERFAEIPIKGFVEAGSFVGEQRDNAQLRFAPDKKRHTLGAIEVSVSGSPEKLIGKSLDTPCTFEATRIAPNSPSRVIRVVVPPDGGSYFAASTPRERCNAIIAWTRRFSGEYPDIDPQRTVLGKLYPKIVLLFADEEFVPVFGQAFEEMPYEKRKSAWGDLQKNCVRDPLVSPDMKVYSVINDAFSTRPDNPGGSFAPRAIIHQIRDTRATRYAITAIANPKLKSGSAPDYTTEQLERLSEDVKKEIHILWPSERKLALETIASASNMNASGEAERNLQLIADITDPKSQMEEINKVLPLKKTPYGAHLSAAVRDEFTGRLESLRQAATRSLLVPIVAKVQSVPDAEDGLAVIASLKDESEKILVLAGPAARKEYDDLLDAKRARALGAAVEESLRQLADFPLEVQGLLQSAEWYAEFTSHYEAYKDEDSYKKALDVFEIDRKRRLEAALPEFTKQIKNTNSSSERAKLLASYLNWPGDDKLPIALEYQLLAD